MAKVAVVTGSNKGIGFGVVRALCKRFDGDVFLTSRDEGRGRAAVAALNKEGLHPKYHQLDITSRQSLETFRDYIKANYSGIDLLVNNAAIAFKYDAPEPVVVQAEQTIFVNYFSLVSTCEILFPILNNGAKVVNVSSSLGHLGLLPSEELRNKFKDPSLTVEQLNALMQKYVDDTYFCIRAFKAGTYAEAWGNSSYRVSKVGVTALTMIQQRALKDRGIIVNAINPGYVDTDMTSHNGRLTIDQGAVSTIYAAFDVTESLPYKYIQYNKAIVDWLGPKMDEVY